MEPAPPGETDEALMDRFCDGDAKAFEALFQRHAGAVRGFLHRRVGSAAAADDITQATFLSLLRGRGRFQRGARLRPWLYAIAVNAARDHQRRGHAEELTAEGELPTVVAEPAAIADVGLERQVRAALEQLPEAQREAILLHRYQGLTFGEIAEALGEVEVTIKVRAHRGYEKLRVLLAPLREEL